MGKLSKYGEKRTKKKLFEKVEMIIRSKSAHAGMEHQIMAHRRSFLLNVPRQEDRRYVKVWLRGVWKTKHTREPHACIPTLIHSSIAAIVPFHSSAKYSTSQLL